MARGGRRANSGRRGLTFEEKNAALARRQRLIIDHFPIRERRAFERLVRGRVMADEESYLDELLRHYRELHSIGDPTPEEKAKMTPDQIMARRAKARARLLADYRRNPETSTVYSFFNDLRLRSRLLRVPNPSKADMGGFHQQIADEMAARLGRPISRQQIADACREMVAFYAANDPHDDVSP
jgi:hypothetical protein